MPPWLSLVFSFMVLLALALACVAALWLRRRAIGRQGVSFDMSVTTNTEYSPRGWMLGVGVYSESQLAWYRTLSFSPRPKYVFSRRDLIVEGRRVADGEEAVAVGEGHLISTVKMHPHVRQFAMTPEALTALLAWLESSPPGAGISQVH